MSDIKLAARNAGLDEIRTVLEDQRARRLDVVAPSGAITAKGGMLVVEGTQAPVITEDGVDTTGGTYRPTEVADEGLGARFGIPTAWLKEMRRRRTDLYDLTVNGMIHGTGATGIDGPDGPYPPHTGSHLLRLLQGDPGEPGVARAVLSHKYAIRDSLDMLVALLQGIRDSGTQVHVGDCDLSERRMYVRLEAPGIAAVAPKLLEGYRSQFDGPNGRSRAGRGGLHRERGAWDLADARALARAEGMGYKDGEEPIVWAGLVAANSDVGQGSLYLAPQIRVRVCRNGLTVTTEASRRVHLGAAQAEGTIDWSAETIERELALITAQVRDAVTAWLSQGYLEEQVNKIEVMAGVPVLAPERTVREVTKAAGFTRAQADEILAFFVQGGQLTAAGVANAATAYAQTVESPEVAFDLEGKALAMMEHAARIG